MREDLEAEVAELRREYEGLTRLREGEDGLVVSGPLPFEASSDGHETIADAFEIDLIVPAAYPKALPWVLETSGRIRDDYEHVYANGKLCLAVPTEERLIFGREPCLRGFVTNLVIPYCYGYCYWERHGVHPFGEREHGGRGLPASTSTSLAWRVKCKHWRLHFISSSMAIGGITIAHAAADASCAIVTGRHCWSWVTTIRRRRHGLTLWRSLRFARTGRTTGNWNFPDN